MPATPDTTHDPESDAGSNETSGDLGRRGTVGTRRWQGATTAWGRSDRWWWRRVTLDEVLCTSRR